MPLEGTSIKSAVCRGQTTAKCPQERDGHQLSRSYKDEDTMHIKIRQKANQSISRMVSRTSQQNDTLAVQNTRMSYHQYPSFNPYHACTLFNKSLPQSRQLAKSYSSTSTPYPYPPNNCRHSQRHQQMVLHLLQPEKEDSRNQPFEKKTLANDKRKMGNRNAI